MSDQSHQDEAGPQAPAKLVEALRQLDAPAMLVPPQIDDAALTRPRMHLARIRERIAQGQGQAETPAEDLALAARTEEPRPSGTFNAQEPLSPIASERHRSKVIVWVIVTVLAAAALLLWAYWKHSPRSF